MANLTFGPARTWVAPSQATIRPGVQTVTEGAGQCTSDFIFTSLDNMTVYIGQAAHCASLGGASDTNGCLTESLPLGTSVEVEGASQPGRLAYSSWIAMQEDGGAGADACARNDFALVELAPADAAKANPAMLHYGGPTALADAESMAWGDKVLTYGNSGLRFGLSPLSPHEGYVVESGGSGGWTTTIYTAPNGVPGDSGSGVLTADGQALGILVTLNSYPPAANGVTSLDHALDYAANHGMPVQLATWEQLDEGILP